MSKIIVWMVPLIFITAALCGCGDSCNTSSPMSVTLTPGPAPQGWGSVRGVVVDGETELPMENVTVSLTLRQARGSYTQETDGEGVYFFENVPYGDYDLVFEPLWGSGYIGRSQQVAVAGDTGVRTVEIANSLMLRLCGGTAEDGGNSVIETAEGYLAVVGKTHSVDGDLEGLRSPHPEDPEWIRGDSDLWLLVIDPENENILFSQVYGGEGEDEGFGLAETAEGCLAVTGKTNSGTGDLQGIRPSDPSNPGGERYDSDLWFLVIDWKNPSGKGIRYNRTYGGTGEDAGSAIVLLDDGRLAVAGNTSSEDLDLQGLRSAHPEDPEWGRYDSDLWLLVIDWKTGAFSQQVYGGTGNDAGTALVSMGAGKVAVTGYTSSEDLDLTGQRPPYPIEPEWNPRGDWDIWLLILDTNALSLPDRGKLASRIYGGYREDAAQGISLVPDGRLAIVGETNSEDLDLEDLRSPHPENPEWDRYDRDLWILVVNPDNLAVKKGIEFSQTYGGFNDDAAAGVSAMKNGFLAVTGQTNSADGDLEGVVPPNEDDRMYTFIWTMIVDPAASQGKGIQMNTVYGENVNIAEAGGVAVTENGCLAVAGMVGGEGAVPTFGKSTPGPVNAPPDLVIMDINQQGKVRMHEPKR